MSFWNPFKAKFDAKANLTSRQVYIKNAQNVCNIINNTVNCIILLSNRDLKKLKQVNKSEAEAGSIFLLLNEATLTEINKLLYWLVHLASS